MIDNCRNCGKLISIKETKCPHCGILLDEKKAKKKSNGKELGRAFIILASLGFIVYLLVNSGLTTNNAYSEPSLSNNSIAYKVALLDKREFNQQYIITNEFLLKEISKKTGDSQETIAEIVFKTQKGFSEDKGLNFSLQELLNHVNNGIPEGSNLSTAEACAFLRTVVTEK